MVSNQGPQPQLQIQWQGLQAYVAAILAASITFIHKFSQNYQLSIVSNLKPNLHYILVLVFNQMLRHQIATEMAHLQRKLY